MITRKSVSVALVSGALLLAGCTPASQDAAATGEAAAAAPETAPDNAPAAAPVSAPTFAAAGGASPATLAPEASDAEGEAASLGGIVRFDAVPGQSGEGFVRLIGTAGGDPAANGLMTYLVISTAHDSWVYTIGNIIDYRIKGAADGRLDLEIDETTVADNGDMNTATRKLIVTWTPVPDDYAPGGDWTPTVTTTAAR